MRGIVSLAAALALPQTAASGAPFAYRADILVITFVVILSTLVVQGLSLAPLIRLLKLRDEHTLEHEEALARHHAATMALQRLDRLVQEGWAKREHLDRLRVHYRRRADRFANPRKADPDCSAECADAFRRLRHETLTAERFAAVDLRNRDIISDEVLHRVEQELDVEVIRLGIGDFRPDGALRSPTRGGV